MADERDLAIAGVYAQALLDLAAEADRAGEVREELDALVGLLDEHPAFARALSDPLLDVADKSAMVERTLRGRLSGVVVDTLQVMCRKGRLGLVRGLARAFRRALDEREGRVEVRVVTAVPLDEGRREALTRAASHFAGRKAVLDEHIDPSLLGGMVVHVGDYKIDTSVARELRKLSARLLERASNELQHGRDYTVDG